MFRISCIFVVVIFFGCAYHQQGNTFKEKYNVYAEPKPDFSNKVIVIPNAEPYPALAFEQCGLPISVLEDFIDALVHRIDAKNLTENHAAQDRLDTLFLRLRDMLEMDEHKTLYTFPEGYAYRVLLSYYMARNEEQLKSAFATVQYLKYQRNQ